MIVLWIKNNKVINIVEADSFEEYKNNTSLWQDACDKVDEYISHELVWEKYGPSVFFPKHEAGNDTVSTE